MLKVAVTGAAGRMGSGIIRKITEQDDMEVVAAIEMPNTPLAGKDAGEQAGIGPIGVPIVGSEDLEKALKESGAEVLVDFTIAFAAVETCRKCRCNQGKQCQSCNNFKLLNRSKCVLQSIEGSDSYP